MPWCEECAKFWNPTTLRPDGTCPSCGHAVAAAPEETKAPKAPWHFKLMVAAAGGYLLWRLVQGLDWLIEAVF